MKPWKPARTALLGSAFLSLWAMASPSAPARPKACPAATGEKDAQSSATFDPIYQVSHRNRVETVVPEVYEMINVALALTPAVAAEPGCVPATAYSERVVKRFGPMRTHPLVKALDARLRAEPIIGYIDFKLNSYAFDFDAGGRVVRSKVYRQLTEGDNPLVALLPQMQSFASQSGFRRFFAENRNFYRQQTRFFDAHLDAPAMVNWLKTEFPAVRPYDSIKIVLSPLAGNIQNEVSLEDRCFREMQAHVNIPTRTLPGLSADANVVWQGTQLFGELNHGFINPAAEPYAGAIAAAIGNRADWSAVSNDAAYPDDQAVFNEYMNFALISLYQDAKMTAADAVLARKRIDFVMAEQRGFPRFVAFNAMLRDLYASRKPGQTVADLYPQIIAWVASQSTSEH